MVDIPKAVDEPIKESEKPLSKANTNDKDEDNKVKIRRQSTSARIRSCKSTNDSKVKSRRSNTSRRGSQSLSRKLSSKTRSKTQPDLKQDKGGPPHDDGPIKPTSSDPAELWQQVIWHKAYFGAVESHHCEFLLVKNGDFLIRLKQDFPEADKQHQPESTTNCPLIITVKLHNKIQHYLIHVGPKKAFFFGGIQMSNLEQLIDHHVDNKIPMPLKLTNENNNKKNKDSSRCLKRAIHRPTIDFGSEDNIIFDDKQNDVHDQTKETSDTNGGGHEYSEGTISRRIAFINEINKPNDRKIVIKTWHLNMNEPTMNSLIAMMRIQKLYNSSHLLAIAGFIQTDNKVHFIYPKSDYGSLYTYIRQNNDVTVRQKFKISSDIADGMAYLEKLKIAHGRLTSKNCIMGYQGSRVLVTDFKPLQAYLDGLKQSKITSYATRYLAIEILEALQKKSLSHDQMNLSADCWGYGTILYEVFSGEMPYSNFSTVEIFNYILSGYRLDPVLASDEIRDCIRTCFDTNPVNRPSFKLIHQKIKDLYLTLNSDQK